jgi:cytochrome c556
MKSRTVLICLSLALGSAALAHEGVKNEAVKARMHTMKQIGQEMKKLGTMVKGEAPFDQATARAAAAAIAGHAADTPALFEAQEDDPKSEAKPEIWASFDDFTAKSNDLQTAALSLSTSIESLEDVQAAMKTLGGTCKACHKSYRE